MAQAEVTIGGAQYAVYASEAFADTYLAGDMVRADRWAATEDTDKAKALVTATRALVRLPWTDGVPPDITAPPEVVQEACAQLAADLVDDPELADTSGAPQQFKRVKAGSVEVEYREGVRLPPTSNAVWQLLLRAGLVGGDSSLLGLFDGGYYSDGCQRSRFGYGDEPGPWGHTLDDELAWW
jgi:hypothetical protein